MAVRGDVTVNWAVSPRIIEVAAPSVSISIQDLVDTCRTLESQLGALDDERLIDASGKENLGQGVRVGVTMVLVNAKLKFQARLGPSWTICNVAGGNLVAIDADGNDMDPIEPSAYVTVVRTSSSSATLQEADAIQYASYGGGVTIDYINGTDGIEYPIGTEETPCKTLANAVAIATVRGFHDFFFKSDYTFTAGTYINNYDLHGKGMLNTTFIFDPGSIVAYCHAHDAICTGDITGLVGFENCKIINMESTSLVPSSSSILIKSCLVAGALSMPSVYSGTLTILDSWSTPELGEPPIIDFQNATASIQVRNFSGFMTFKNITEDNDIDILLSSGGIVLHSSVDGGNFIISGVGILDNQSTSVTSLNVDGLISTEAVWSGTTDGMTYEHIMQLSAAVANGNFSYNPATNLLTIFKRDGLTPLTVVSVPDDDTRIRQS